MWPSYRYRGSELSALFKRGRGAPIVLLFWVSACTTNFDSVEGLQTDSDSASGVGEESGLATDTAPPGPSTGTGTGDRDSERDTDTGSDSLPDGGEVQPTDDDDTETETQTKSSVGSDTNVVPSTDTRGGTGTASAGTDTDTTDGTSSATDTRRETDTETATEPGDSETYTETDTAEVCEVPDCVFYVDLDAQGAMNGTSWSDAYLSVQEGINAAEAAAETCEVWVAEGTYYIFVTGKGDTVQLVSGVYVYGGFAGTELDSCDRDSRPYRDHESVLSGCRSGSECEDEALRVNSVVNGASDSRLDGFVVEYGLTGYGAGLSNTSVSDLVVAHCLFRSNKATDYGGGIYNVNSAIRVDECVFLANEAANYGAGICNVGNSFSSIRNSVFVRNVSFNHGGGIANVDGGSAEIFGSAVLANTARNTGAGIFSVGASQALIIEDTIISDNQPLEISAQIRGGGLYLSNGDLTVSDSIFIGNDSGNTYGSAVAEESQGAYTVQFSGTVFYRNHSNDGNSIHLDVQGGEHSFQNVTVWENNGGIALFTGGTPSLSVTNSILWENSGNAISAPGGFSGLHVSYSDLSPDMGGTNISADPYLVGARADGNLVGAATCRFDEATSRTEIVVSNGSWTPGELIHLFLVDDSREIWRTIVDNSEDTLWIWGDLIAGFGADACSNLSILDLNPRAVSPCVDAASGVGAPTVDLQGKSRIDIPTVPNGVDCDAVQDPCMDGVDMGAYEYHP